MLIVLICFSITGCSQAKSTDDERKETMTKIIKAFASNDTLSLYNLIDTSACFRITGKESFSENENFLYLNFSKDKIILNNSDFKSVPAIPKNNASYKIVFPLQMNDRFDSIAVKFDFIYGTSRKVYFFEVLYFTKPGKEEPLEKIY